MMGGVNKKLRYVSTGLYPAYQERFATRVADELGILLDLSTYCVNRGRGWGLSDGSSGACVSDWDGKCYLLERQMAKMASSKRPLVMWDDWKTGELFIGLEMEYKVKGEGD